VMRQTVGTTQNVAAECRQSGIAWDGVTDNSDTVAPGESQRKWRNTVQDDGRTRPMQEGTTEIDLVPRRIEQQRRTSRRGTVGQVAACSCSLIPGS
jgi:hypothetical protein